MAVVASAPDMEIRGSDISLIAGSGCVCIKKALLMLDKN